MGDEDDYSSGRNAGEYGGPVPDMSSSEAMRGYYDGVRYRESMQQKPESGYQPYQYTTYDNTYQSQGSLGSAVAEGVRGLKGDIAKAKVRAAEWSRITKHGKIYAWIYNVLFITAKTAASVSVLPIVVGLLFQNNLITGAGGMMLIVGLAVMLFICLPAFLVIKLIGYFNKRRT